MSAIDSLCRTCMTNVIDNTEQAVCGCNIFEIDGLVEKLMQCSNIEIQPYDEYPTRVCHKCCIKIHEFCGFQEMCRESLEKFSKMLEKQTKKDSYIPKILGDHGGVVVSKGHQPNTIDIEFDSNHVMILGDHSIAQPRDSQDDIIQIKSEYDSDVAADNDPLTGTKDCVIAEAISIARRERMGKIINCEHDYSLSGQAPVLRPIVGAGDKGEDEQGDDSSEVVENEDESALGYNNMLEIISSVDEAPLYLNPVSNEFNPTMLENVSTDNEEYRSEEIHLFENLLVNEESFSEINVTGSSAKAISITPCFNETPVTPVTNDANTSMENTFSNKVCLEDDKDPLFGDISDERKNNYADLHNIGFENKEDFIFNNPSEDKDVHTTQLENDDCENEEGYIFKILSEDEENSIKRQKHVPEEETNEYHMFSTPSEDKEICSDSGTVLSGRKPKQKRKRVSCDLCPQTFILEHRLIAHKRRHQGLNGYPCSRENCTRSYNRLIELRKHLDDHDGISPKIYKCYFDDCEFKYTTKSGLHLHLRKFHKYGPASPDRKYVCETCGTIFKYLSSLQIHQYIHVDESLWPFKCEIDGCSKSFRSEKFYKIHKNRHYGIKLYACTYCDKRFCSNPNLQMHINFHTLEKKYACSFCPRICYTPQSLRKHIKNVHENQPYTGNTGNTGDNGESSIVCDECGRSFKRDCDLRMHKQTHLPRGPPKARETVKNFYCSVCNKALAQAINLKRHEMKHTEGKQFECDKCGVKFSYRRNLQRHQQQNVCIKSKTTKDKYPVEEDSIEVSIIDKNDHINVEDM